MARVQRGILDDAGHEDVSLEESVQWRTIVGPPLFDATWAAIEQRRQDEQIGRDLAVLADLASRAPRPSLWTRTPDWVIGAAAVAVFVLLVLSPWITS